MKKCLNAVLLLVVAFALTACGGDEAGGNGDTDTADGNGTVEVDVTMVDIAYEPDSVSVPSGSELVVNLVNEGDADHDFHLEDGSGSSMLSSGESETVQVGPFTESTTAWCTVPGHREAGMEFDIEVN
jgi:nitrite reductase (NO-forming)